MNCLDRREEGMTIEELRQKLQEIKNNAGADVEGQHSDADRLLIKYINDAQVTKIFDDIEKWYA